jgi:hypothetical protein
MDEQLIGPMSDSIYLSWVTLIFGYKILLVHNKICSLGVEDGSAIQLHMPDICGAEEEGCKFTVET